ncbi:MAG: hypothetical protein ACFE9Z_08665 [Promethearchaeota archaeon]
MIFWRPIETSVISTISGIKIDEPIFKNQNITIDLYYFLGPPYKFYKTEVEMDEFHKYLKIELWILHTTDYRHGYIAISYNCTYKLLLIFPTNGTWWISCTKGVGILKRFPLYVYE